MFRHLYLIALAGMLACAIGAQGKKSQSDSHCDAPEHFGICDPYVPGTIIRFEENKPIRVVTTWHRGPAELAGVCPADKIIAVNGVLAAENSRDRMLREIGSATPSPVHLTIERGDRTLELRVRRVRESTLAKLSRQKFIRDPNFRGATALVPRGESRAEFAQYLDFRKRLDESQGFTRIDGLAVPVETPPQQVKRLKEYLFGGREDSRAIGFVGATAGKYSFGFATLVLKDPREALIEAVIPNSPAHRAGLLPGDRVLQIAGREISGMTSGEIKALILEPDKQRTISVKVDRGGEVRIFHIATEPSDRVEAADMSTAIPAAGGPPSPDSYFLGIGVAYSSDHREAMLGELDWPSPAFDAGLHVGDSILAINGRPVSGMTREEITKLLVPENASPMTFEVNRLGRKKTFTVKPVTHRSANAAIGRKWTKSGPVPKGCPSS